MSSITYTFAIRNNAASPPGTRMTGIVPTWVLLKRLSDNSDVTPTPTISEVGQGIYKFSFDAEATGEAIGQVDCGVTLTNPSDRYLDILLTRDSSRIQSGIDSGGKVSLSSAEHTAVATDVQTGLTAQGYTAARGPKLDQLDAAVSSRLAAATYIAPDNANIATVAGRLSAARATLLDNLSLLDAAVSSRLGTSTYIAPDNATITTLASRLTSARALLMDNLALLDAAITTRMDAATYVPPDNANIATLASRLSAARANLLDNLSLLDAAVSSRLATVGYAAPDNANIGTLAARLTAARASMMDSLALLDASISSRMDAASYVPPDNAHAALLPAIKAQTDLIPASPAAVGSAMTLEMGQAVPLSNAPQTVGDSLNAARTAGFGAWQLNTAVSPPTVTLFAPDGITPVRTFSLDDANNPTSRS